MEGLETTPSAPRPWDRESTPASPCPPMKDLLPSPAPAPPIQIVQPTPRSGLSEASHSPSVPSPTDVPLSRVVCIALPHATLHRDAILRRFVDAGFECLDEFSWDAVEDVLRDDMEIGDGSLIDAFTAKGQTGELSAYVWLLERSNAFGMLQDIMGDADPSIARQTAPNSLRAQFGGDNRGEIAVWTSSTPAMALEHCRTFFDQLDDGDDQHGSPDSHHLQTPAEDGLPRFPDNDGFPSFADAAEPLRKKKSSIERDRPPPGAFKAQPVPATTHQPEIQPRPTRASLLRMGSEVSAVSTTSSSSSNPPQRTDFATVPGYQRKLSLDVPSTRAPTIVPRPTRASLARQGSDLPPPRRKATAEEAAAAFDGVPGHKRRQTISVASTAAPEFAPRQTKASAVRAGGQAAIEAKRAEERERAEARIERLQQLEEDKEKARRGSSAATLSMLAPIAPPQIGPRDTKASKLRRDGDAAGRSLSTSSTTTLKTSRPSSVTGQAAGSRLSSRPPSSAADADSLGKGSSSTGTGGSASSSSRPRPSIASILPPTHEVRQTKAALMRAGVAVPSAPVRRPSSSAGLPASSSTSSAFEGIPGHKRRESIAVASTAAPSIQPRLNRAQALRLGLPVPERATSEAAAVPPVPPVKPPALKPRAASMIGPSTSTSSSLDDGEAAAPKVHVRMNRAAALRTLSGDSVAGNSAAPSSFNFGGSDKAKTPAGGSRPSSALGSSSRPSSALSSSRTPLTPARSNKAADLRAAKRASMAF